MDKPNTESTERLRVTWQKLCPQGVETGSSNRSRQMEQVNSCSENRSGAAASAIVMLLQERQLSVSAAVLTVSAAVLTASFTSLRGFNLRRVQTFTLQTLFTRHFTASVRPQRHVRRPDTDKTKN